MKSEPRIAFVADVLAGLGGGERVLITALEAFPHADVFTLVYNKAVFQSSPIANRKIKTSWIDSLPLVHARHRMFLPLMPSAIEWFDMREYDIIVSFSYAVAHGVRPYNGARHVSYTYTPMRYAWLDLNLDGTHAHKNPLLEGFMQAFRDWDLNAASRVHQFAAISQAVSQRIQRAYRRDAPIIYPPVDVRRFTPSHKRENYYVTVTRLVPHKRVDILVQAFSKLGLPLIVIGEGAELPRLKNMAGSTIQFLGYQSDEKVTEYLGKAASFVCVAEEDFGIAIVEAQAAGCPVIAYGQGGALDTVIDGVTGVFFQEQTAESLMEAIHRFEKLRTGFHIPDLVRNSQRFDKYCFLSQFINFIHNG